MRFELVTYYIILPSQTKINFKKDFIYLIRTKCNIQIDGTSQFLAIVLPILCKMNIEPRKNKFFTCDVKLSKVLY